MIFRKIQKDFPYYSPFFRPIFCLLELIIMSDFGMAETDDGLTPKIGRSGILDVRTFILGQWNYMGKEHIHKFLIV